MKGLSEIVHTHRNKEDQEININTRLDVLFDFQNNTVRPGFNALFYAIVGNHHAAVEYLIMAGADLTIKLNNMTPYDYAVRRGYPDIAKLLKQHAEPGVIAETPKSKPGC